MDPQESQVVLFWWVVAARENAGARFGTVSELTKAWQGAYFALLQLHSVLVATTLDWKN
jgi:hypothetical protein